VTGPLSVSETLLASARPDRPRRLASRELAVEVTLAAAVLGAGAACAVLLTAGRPVEPVAAAGCLAAYVAAARTRLYVGAGSALGTQLAFVPMLFMLPLGWVPLAVAAALTLSALPDVLARRAQRDRLVTSAGDAGHALAPVLVLAAAGSPEIPAWGIVLAAAGAQCVFDAALSTGREWLGRGIRPRVQLAVIATVSGVDVLLLPLAVLLAQHAVAQPAAVLAVLPLTLLLGAGARDRNRRLEDALERLAALERERARVREAIRRTGRSLGVSLVRQTVLEVAVGTAVAAVGGAAGRARLIGSGQAMTFEAMPHQAGGAESVALMAAERAALAGHASVAEAVDGWWAIARPLISGRRTLGAMAVCRATGPFTDDETELFAYLVAQAAASLDTIDLNGLLQGWPEAGARRSQTRCRSRPPSLRARRPR
jgi:hypothetical protein